VWSPNPISDVGEDGVVGMDFTIVFIQSSTK
jgi:hypothetical protein